MTDLSTVRTHLASAQIMKAAGATAIDLDVYLDHIATLLHAIHNLGERDISARNDADGTAKLLEILDGFGPYALVTCGFRGSGDDGPPSTDELVVCAGCRDEGGARVDFTMTRQEYGIAGLTGVLQQIDMALEGIASGEIGPDATGQVGPLEDDGDDGPVN